MFHEFSVIFNYGLSEVRVFKHEIIKQTHFKDDKLNIKTHLIAFVFALKIMLVFFKQLKYILITLVVEWYQI